MNILKKKNNQKELYKHKGGNITKKDRVFLKLCAKLEPADVKNSEGVYEIARTTMLIGDGIFNGRLFPKEEMEKSLSAWEGKPFILNHDSYDIGQVVGFLTDAKIEGDKLTVQPVLDPVTKNYDVAKGYIQSRFNAGDTPNVSVGMYVDNRYEDINGVEDQWVVRNWKPDHLGIVMNGACNPDDGCGIGMSNSTNYNNLFTFESKGEIIIPIKIDLTYLSKNDKERKELEKEILIEEIKEEKLK